MGSEGSVTTVRTGIKLAAAVASSSTYDPVAKVLYMVYQQELGALGVVGLDAATGATVYTSPPTDLYTIDFHNGLLLGFALAVAPAGPYQYRTLSGLDPRTNATRVVANLTDWASNLPATAVDPAAGTLSAMLLPQGGTSASLVTLDLNKAGAVVGSPQLCTEYDYCPWSLVYL